MLPGSFPTCAEGHGSPATSCPVRGVHWWSLRTPLTHTHMLASGHLPANQPAPASLSQSWLGAWVVCQGGEEAAMGGPLPHPTAPVPPLPSPREETVQENGGGAGCTVRKGCTTELGFDLSFEECINQSCDM